MKEHKEKIGMHDTMIDALYKVSEGNPGALNVLVQTVKTSAVIDPDDAFGDIGPLLSLDSYGIYGSNIWILYKDCCHENIEGFLAVIRSIQMGLLDIEDVWNSIKNSIPIDTDVVMKNLQKKLPRFNLEKTV